MDTSVFVAALISPNGASRQILRFCFSGNHTPLMGEKLFLEMEDVLGRTKVFEKSPLSRQELDELFNGFLAVCEWTPVFYLWRPHLVDEGDNHIIELAVAGGADAIVTHNLKDFNQAELRFPDFEILTPKDFLNQ